MSQRNRFEKTGINFSRKSKSYGFTYQLSIKRKSKGKSPLEMMEFLNPELYKRFIEYGIKKIERDKIVLKPYLLKDKK